MTDLSEIAARYPTDKASSIEYLRVYSRIFQYLQTTPGIRLLELGVHAGGSLQMWRDFFLEPVICGIDRSPPLLDLGSHITVIEGEQDDIQLLDLAAQQCAPNGFNIIIDDAAHIGKIARSSLFYAFKNILIPGGIYVIEDWGTGYWDEWPDGKKYEAATVVEKTIQSHSFGMVGFVKELVDHVGRLERMTDENDLPISNMEIHPGLVVLNKSY